MRSLPARLLPEVVHVQTPGEDLGDGAVLGPKVPHPARVEREQRLVRSATGDEVVAGAQVIMRAGAIAVGDVLTLPGDDSPAVVLAVREQWDRTHPVAVLVDVA